MFQLVMIEDLESSIFLEPKRKKGDVVWVRDMLAARHLIENGFCKWPEAGPQHKPEFEPSEKKFVGDLTAGPSTDSPSSIESGKDAPQSASAEVLVAPQRT